MKMCYSLSLELLDDATTNIILPFTTETFYLYIKMSANIPSTTHLSSNTTHRLNQTNILGGGSEESTVFGLKDLEPGTFLMELIMFTEPFF